MWQQYDSCTKVYFNDLLTEYSPRWCVAPAVVTTAGLKSLLFNYRKRHKIARFWHKKKLSNNVHSEKNETKAAQHKNNMWTSGLPVAVEC